MFSGLTSHLRAVEIGVSPLSGTSTPARRPCLASALLTLTCGAARHPASRKGCFVGFAYGRAPPQPRDGVPVAQIAQEGVSSASPVNGRFAGAERVAATGRARAVSKQSGAKLPPLTALRRAYFLSGCQGCASPLRALDNERSGGNFKGKMLAGYNVPLYSYAVNQGSRASISAYSANSQVTGTPAWKTVLCGSLGAAGRTRKFSRNHASTSGHE